MVCCLLKQLTSNLFYTGLLAPIRVGIFHVDAYHERHVSFTLCVEFLLCYFSKKAATLESFLSLNIQIFYKNMVLQFKFNIDLVSNHMLKL